MSTSSFSRSDCLLEVQLYCVRQNILFMSILVYYNTNTWLFWDVSHLLCTDWSVQFINQGLSVSEQMFHYFMLFLYFIDPKYSFLRSYVWYQYFKICLVLAWSFPQKHFLYCYLALPALIVIVSFFSISNYNIHKLFPEICDLSGNFWSEAPFSVF